MAIGDDFSVTSAGDIRHVSGSTTYTVLELHRWLQDLADDSVAGGNDLVDITSSTPSERSTDNIISLLGNYNIDDDAAKYLYNGSISQDSGDTLYSGLVVVGSVYSTTILQIIQNNSLYDGDDPFWGTGLNADASNNILMRCLIKTRTGGSDIDSKNVRIQARELGDTYAEFSVSMGLGNSTAAIFTNQDLNNQTASGSIAGWDTITNTVSGYNLIDLNNGSGSKPYYSKWDRDSYTINQLYERAKWLTVRGTDQTLYGLNGELFRGITHQVPLTADSGTWDAFESVSWSGGTGQMLAIDNTSTPTKMWIQLLTGSAPTDTQPITGGSSSATATVNGSPTSRTLSSCFLGQSTGTSIIGSYGIGIEASDLTNSDKLFDLNNDQQVPPNNVTFTVSSVVSGEDYVLVGPASAGSLLEAQLTADGVQASGSSSLVVNETIPSDTPSEGTVRVKCDDGVYHKLTYSSYATSTFTLSAGSELPEDVSDNANVFISYIDTLANSTSVSYTCVYDTDRNLFVRVRDGGGTPIKTFETPATNGSAGGSVAAIRTSDA